MSDETEVIYVADLARILGRTEASVREGIRRGVSWLPKGFKMGIRHCWLRTDVMQFLTDHRDGKIQTSPIRAGKNRQAPNALKSIGR